MPWLEEEEDILLDAVIKHGKGHWVDVSSFLTGRTPMECNYHYTKMKRRPSDWKDPIKDVKLVMGVRIFSSKTKKHHWTEIAKHMFEMQIDGMHCSERYSNCLDPRLVNEPWTESENQSLRDLVAKYGKKWSLISSGLKGRRTDCACTKQYNLLIRKEKKLKNPLFKPAKQESKKKLQSYG